MGFKEKSGKEYLFFCQPLLPRFGNCDTQNKAGCRPGWEWHAIALSRARTRHIKDTRVVCCAPETLYSVLSHLFLIHALSSLLIPLFIITQVKFSVTLNSTFYFFFFFYKVTFSFSCTCYLLNTLDHSSHEAFVSVSFVYNVTRNDYSLQFYISFPWRLFLLNLCLTICCVMLFIYKNSNWFLFSVLT